MPGDDYCQALNNLSQWWRANDDQYQDIYPKE